MSTQQVTETDYQLKVPRMAELSGIVQAVARDLSMKLEWAPYLNAAPAAICVMATCLVAGSSDDAAIIEIKLQRMGILDGLGIKKTQYLGSNLHECTRVGREAFGEAQDRMLKLQSRAELVVQDGGTLAQILEVLRDSEPLISTLERGTRELQDVASICQDEARIIKEKFAALLKFIENLRSAVVDARNENKAQSKRLLEASARDSQRQRDLQAAKKELEGLQAELEQAKQDLRRAQDQGAAALNNNTCQTIQSQIDDINDELKKIWRDEQEERNKPAYRKLFKMVSEGVFGTEQTARRIQAERKQDLCNQLEALVARRENLIDKEQKKALENVEAKERKVADIEERLNKSKEAYLSLFHREFEATKILDSAHSDLQDLSDKKLDLEKISDILNRSIKALRELNKYIEQMTTFFTEVSSYVDDVMRIRVDQFKNKAEEDMAAENDRSSEENERHRMSAIRNVLELHARFSLISDIARIYGTVSKKYILPGIRLMDGLTDLDEDEYEMELEKFKKWSKNAVKEIDRMVIAENANIGSTLLNKMVSLAKQQLGSHHRRELKQPDGQTWISTPGWNVVNNAKSTFEIFIEEGVGRVRPRHANERTGAVQFMIPSPQRNGTLTDLNIEFYPQAVRVDGVAVFFANEEVFKKERLQKTDSFQLNCGSIPCQPKGITMVIYINFDSVGSAITFQSVGMKVV